jgi:uncharacterized protein
LKTRDEAPAAAATPAQRLDFTPPTADIRSMNREDVIARLRALRPRLNAEGIKHLYLFGSVLHDEAAADSDADLFFDHNLPKFGLFEYIHLKDLANELMDQEVDLIERSCLHPRLRARIQAEALRIF